MCQERSLCCIMDWTSGVQCRHWEILHTLSSDAHFNSADTERFCTLWLRMHISTILSCQNHVLYKGFQQNVQALASRPSVCPFIRTVWPAMLFRNELYTFKILSCGIFVSGILSSEISSDVALRLSLVPLCCKALNVFHFTLRSVSTMRKWKRRWTSQREIKVYNPKSIGPCIILIVE